MQRLPTKELSPILGSLKQFVVSNDLYLVPLQSIKAGTCTCRNPDCSSPGKHPLLKYSWKHVATNDSIKVEKWLSQSNVNFGVATGKLSRPTGKYLVVLDVDAETHPILDKLPATFSYKTGSGGWHFWFWSKYAVPSSVGKIADQVDVRGAGAYVVVPPSKHISGKTYGVDSSFFSETPICDFPDFLVKLAFCKTRSKKGSEKLEQEPNFNFVFPENQEDPETPPTTKKWSRDNVATIRKWISEDGKQIPVGIRNVVIHRLLSSDRARGATMMDLFESAQKYRTQCVNSGSIRETELRAMVVQVSRYEAYNTTFEKINEAYFIAMARGRNPISEEQQREIIRLDNLFFSGLVRLGEGERGLGLQEIAQSRNRMMEQGCGPHYSKYPLPLLAAKLKAQGYQRSRTASRNLWNVRIPHEFIGLTNKPNDGTLKLQTVIRPSAEISGALHMTMKMDREFTIKRTKHPSEPRYPGRENQELGSALTKLVLLLGDDERNQLLERRLIVDEEASAKDFDIVQAKDRIGIALDFSEGWMSTQMTVDKIENDTIFGKDHFTEEELEVTFEETSVARAMGYFEVLYRPDADGKMVPFGVDTEQKVKVFINEPDEETPAGGEAPATEPSAADQEAALDKEAADAASVASTNPEALRALQAVKKKELEARQKMGAANKDANKKLTSK